MINHKIISIIIPVFNVEKYIERCLLSCVMQDIHKSKYEIIVVNDGSPDKSLDIAERIARAHENIQIISQENQGLSAARNTGLLHAKGEYIWFVDSDDYIEENCLGRITAQLKDNLDILQLQHRLVYEEKISAKDVDFCRIDGVKSGAEITMLGGLPAPAQFSIYRADFLRKYKLEFMIGIYHEDSEFKPRVTYLAERIVSDTVYSYNYLQRTSGSIMSKFKLKNGIDIITVCNSLLSFMDKQKVPKKYYKYFYQQIGLNLNTLLEGLHKLSKNDKEELINKLQENNHLFKKMFLSENIKYKMEGLILYISISFGIYLHKLIR